MPASYAGALKSDCIKPLLSASFTFAVPDQQAFYFLILSVSLQVMQHSRTQHYLGNFNRMLQSTRHRSLTDFRLPASETLRILLKNCWLCLLMTRCVFCGVPCGTHYSSIVNLQISCCTHLYIFIAPKQLVKSHLLSLERYIFQGAVFLLGIQFSSK